MSIEDLPCPQVLGGGAYVTPNFVWEIAQVMMMMKVKHYLYLTLGIFGAEKLIYTVVRLVAYVTLIL